MRGRGEIEIRNVCQHPEDIAMMNKDTEARQWGDLADHYTMQARRLMHVQGRHKLLKRGEMEDTQGQMLKKQNVDTMNKIMDMAAIHDEYDGLA